MKPRTMKASLRAKLLISSLLGASLLAGLAAWVGFNQLWEVLVKASPEWLTLSLLMIAATYPIRAIRWRLLLLPVKNAVKLDSALWATSIGLLLNTLIPVRVGEVGKAYILSKAERLSFSSTLSSVVVERVLDLAGLTLLGGLAALWLGLRLKLPSWILNGVIIVAALAATALAVIIILARRRVTVLELAVRALERAGATRLLSRRLAKVREEVELFLKGAEALNQHRSTLTLITLLTILLWLVHCSVVYLFFKAFGFTIIHLDVLILGAVLLNLSFILPAPPSYVGTFEAYWMLIFTALGVGGVEALLSIGVVAHLATLAVIAVLGSIATIKLEASVSKIVKGASA